MGDLRQVGEGHPSRPAFVLPIPQASGERDGALVRVIEGEILPRLMLVLGGTPRRTARVPSAAEIARFSAVLLRPGPVDIAGEVDGLLAEGLSLESLLLGLLSPAARHLGTLWEEDLCDFLVVTEGLGRLQAIARRLCTLLERAAPPAGRSVLLVPCPGESHGFGLAIVASFFREAGWDTTLAAHPDDSPAAMVGRDFYDVAGLSLSCDVHVPALRLAVTALRRASCNPRLRVIVGGPWFERHGAGAEAVGADALAPDGRTAPALAEALLDRPAMAC